MSQLFGNILLSLFSMNVNMSSIFSVCSILFSIVTLTRVRTTLEWWNRLGFTHSSYMPRPSLLVTSSLFSCVIGGGSTVVDVEITPGVAKNAVKITPPGTFCLYVGCLIRNVSLFYMKRDLSLITTLSWSTTRLSLKNRLKPGRRYLIMYVLWCKLLFVQWCMSLLVFLKYAGIFVCFQVMPCNCPQLLTKV